MRTDLIQKRFWIRGQDGNDLTVSETIERGEVAISIQSNDKQGGTSAVRLSVGQWKALCDLKYDIEVRDLEEGGAK